MSNAFAPNPYALGAPKKEADAAPDPVALIEGAARKHQIPANLLMAIAEQAGPDAAVQAAGGLAQAVRGGASMHKALEMATGSRQAADVLADRADAIFEAREAATKPATNKTDTGNTTAGNVARSFGAAGLRMVGGAVDAAGAVLDAAGNDGTAQSPNAPEGLARLIGRKIDRAAQRGSAAIEGTIDPEFRQMMSDSEMQGSITDPSSWSLGANPSVGGVLMNTLKSGVSMIPTVAAGMVAGPVGAAAVGGAMSAGEGMQQGRDEAERLATTPGDDGQPLITRTPAYQDAIKAGATPENATRAAIRSAENWAGAAQGVAGAVGGAATGKILGLGGNVAGKAGAGKTLGRAGTATVSAAEEGAQEVAETAGANWGENIATGQDKAVMRDTFGAAVMGGLMGGATGAAFGGHRAEDAPGVQPADGEVSPSDQKALPAPPRALPAPDRAIEGTIAPRQIEAEAQPRALPAPVPPTAADTPDVVVTPPPARTPAPFALAAPPRPSLMIEGPRDPLPADAAPETVITPPPEVAPEALHPGFERPPEPAPGMGALAGRLSQVRASETGLGVLPPPPAVMPMRDTGAQGLTPPAPPIVSPPAPAPGLIQSAAAIATPPAAPAAPPPARFPDQKPGAAVRLAGSDGSVTDAVFIREEADGNAVVRIHGQEVALPAREFDMARTGAIEANKRKDAPDATPDAPQEAAPMMEPAADAPETDALRAHADDDGRGARTAPGEHPDRDGMARPAEVAEQPAGGDLDPAAGIPAAKADPGAGESGAGVADAGNVDGAVVAPAIPGPDGTDVQPAPVTAAGPRVEPIRQKAAVLRDWPHDDPPAVDGVRFNRDEKEGGWTFNRKHAEKVAAVISAAEADPGNDDVSSDGLGSWTARKNRAGDGWRVARGTGNSAETVWGHYSTEMEARDAAQYARDDAALRSAFEETFGKRPSPKARPEVMRERLKDRGVTVQPAPDQDAIKNENPRSPSPSRTEMTASAGLVQEKPAASGNVRKMHIAQPKREIARKPIKQSKAITARGRELPVEYALAELDDLVPSQNDDGRDNPAFPQELQPRDRSGNRSQEQIRKIAADLKPDLLGETPQAGAGAPIVTRDGVVISGNGRTLALRRAHAEGKAAGYRAWLDQQDYDTAGMKQPVLVRVLTDEMDADALAATAREANERDTAAMSASEQAMADAGAMSPTALDLYRGGDVDNAGNRDFVRAFLGGVVADGDMGSMVRDDGSMTQDAVRRVQSALLARAYGDANLIGAIMESTETSIKAIGGALTDAAARWAQMRDAAEADQIAPQMDQTAALLEAVRLVDRARRAGRKVDEFVGQGDMFSGDTVSPMGRAFLNLMFIDAPETYGRARGREKLAGALLFYADQAMKTRPGVDMLGESADPRSVAQTAKAKFDDRKPGEQQSGLFAAGNVLDGKDDGSPVGSGERNGAREPASAGRSDPQADQGRQPEGLSGDFVRAPDGSLSFGEITADVAQAIGREAAPIRLRQGDEKEGLRHIARSARLAEIQGAGFGSVEGFVAAVADGYDAIHQGRGRSLFIVKKAAVPNHTLVVRLEPDARSGYYDVKTAMVTRPDYMNGKETLWERAQSDQTVSGPPSAISGQSTVNVGADAPSGKGVVMEQRDTPKGEPVATLTGDELGPWEDMLQLGKKAQAWYRKNLVGTTVVMKSTGWPVQFGRTGSKKLGGRKGDIILRAVPALKQMIEGAELVSTRPGEKTGTEQQTFHKVSATVSIAGETHRLIATLREDGNGTFHYDLSTDRGIDESGAANRVAEARGVSTSRQEGDHEVRGFSTPTAMKQASTSALQSGPADINLEVVGGPVNSDSAPSKSFTPGAARRVAQAARERLKALGITAEIEVRPGRAGASGQFDTRTSLISLFRTDDGWRHTLDHEAIHVLRHRGVIRPDEWRALVKRVRRDESLMAAIAKAYPDLSYREQIEEAVAEMFADWRAGREDAGPLRVAFERIAAAFRALASALRGESFLDGAQAMERIAAGDVGRRGPGGGHHSTRQARGEDGRFSVKQQLAYHGTTFDAHAAIMREGKIRGPAYFSPSRSVAEGFAVENGGDETTVVTADLPDDLVLIDLDLPGGALLSVEEAKDYLGEPDWTVSDFVRRGYSLGTIDDVSVKEQRDMDALKAALTARARKAGQAFGSQGWRKGSEFWSDLLTDAMARSSNVNLLSLVPGRPLFKELGRGLMAAQTYIRHKDEMDALRGEWHARAGDTAEAWMKLRRRDSKTNKRFMDLLHEATIAQVDPAQPYVPRRVAESDAEGMTAEAARAAAHAALATRFERLPRPFREMWARVMGDYDALGDAFEAAILKNIEEASAMAQRRAQRDHAKALREIDDDGLTGAERDAAIAEADATLERVAGAASAGGKARMAKLRAVFESNRLAGPYVPLARKGSFFVTVRDANGKVISFSLFETANEQRAYRAEVEKDAPGLVQSGTLEATDEVKAQVDPAFVADVERVLAGAGADQVVMDAIWQRWLETLPDQSIRKSHIHRKNRAGYSADALRAYGDQMFHGGHQLAKLHWSAQLTDDLEEATEEARRAKDTNRAMAVVNEMKKRHAFTMNPTGSAAVAALSGLAFTLQLAASPAAALVNVTQTTVVGIPLMAARFQSAGVAGTSRAIMGAMRDFTRAKGDLATAKVLTADEQAAMAEAIRRGTIDKTQAHSLAGIAEHGVSHSPARDQVQKALGFFFHHAERMNRQVTFMAAYRLAKAEGMAQDAAIESAIDATWEAHFDTQNNARPRFMQNDIGKVLTTFRSFQVNMLWRLFRDLHQTFNGETPELRREARLQAVGITLSMFAHAGIRGVWGYALLTSLLAMFLPGDDDDLDAWLQDALLMEGDGAGVTAWNFIMGAALNGAPGQVTGVDLTNRIGMPELWFREQRDGLKAEEAGWQYVKDALGPAIGWLAGSVPQGLGEIAEGEYWRGTERIVPKAIRDPMKAARYAWEGVQTKKGDEILDHLQPQQIFTQALGFTPMQVSERYREASLLRKRQDQIVQERSGLQRQITQSVADGQGLSDGLRERLLEFNRTYPEYPITSETIRASVRGRARSHDRAQLGVVVNPKLAERLQQGLPQRTPTL